MEKLEYVIEDSTIAEVLGVQNFSNEESAVLELIKNAYDAQSPDVIVTISKTQIIIEDNGIGMNRKKILEAWMHVGKSDKEYIVGEGKTARVLAGSKGVGRFAIARLGAKASVFTKMKGQEAVLWKTDWNTPRCRFPRFPFLPQWLWPQRHQSTGCTLRHAPGLFCTYPQWLP